MPRKTFKREDLYSMKTQIPRDTIRQMRRTNKCWRSFAWEDKSLDVATLVHRALNTNRSEEDRVEVILEAAQWIKDNNPIL